MISSHHSDYNRQQGLVGSTHILITGDNDVVDSTLRLGMRIENNHFWDNLWDSRVPSPERRYLPTESTSLRTAMQPNGKDTHMAVLEFDILSTTLEYVLRRTGYISRSYELSIAKYLDSTVTEMIYILFGTLRGTSEYNCQRTGCISRIYEMSTRYLAATVIEALFTISKALYGTLDDTLQWTGCTKRIYELSISKYLDFTVIKAIPMS